MAELEQQVMVRPELQLALSGQVAPGWQLTQQILLDMKIGEQGEYIVSSSALETYGVGDTPDEAAEDFTSMLLDSFEYLSESEEVLSLHYRTLLGQLRTLLSPC